MFCPNCGSANEPNAVFCRNCGKKMIVGDEMNTNSDKVAKRILQNSFIIVTVVIIAVILLIFAVFILPFII